MKNVLKIIAFTFLSIASVDAKSFGGGGGSRGGGGFSSSSSSSRSSSSYSSRPSSSPSKPSTPSAAPVNKPTPNWGSKPQTSTRPVSAVEQSRYQAAVKSGKTFQTRDAAVADFKTKEAPKYSSRYATEPSTRPSHIPSSYKDSTGATRTIVYNQGGGGYGYYSGGGPGLGTFMLYDMMSDTMMMNAMMSKQNYYVGAPPQPTVVHHTNSGWGFWGWFTALLITGCVITFFFILFRNL